MTDKPLKGKAKRKEKTLLRSEKRSPVYLPGSTKKAPSSVQKTYRKLIKSKIKSL